MFRIIFPLAFVAALLFAPLYSVTSEDEYAGRVENSLTASKMFISEPVDCARNMQFNPTQEGCAPENGITGWAFYAAAASSALAGVLGVLGLLPFIGRLTSMLATGAGGISTATIGWFLFDVWQGGAFAQIEWGAWLAGGLALLTLVTGFNGMSGDND